MAQTRKGSGWGTRWMSSRALAYHSLLQTPAIPQVRGPGQEGRCQLCMCGVLLCIAQGFRLKISLQ